MYIDYNKKEYKRAKKAAKVCGIKTVSFNLMDEVYNYNGITVAYMPSIKNEDCKMLEVSVSYCAKEDKFKKKHGKFYAIERLLSGEMIKLPLGQFLHNFGNKEVKETLRSVFLV